MVESISVEKAMLYEKYRLPYAPEMVNDLLKLAGHEAVVADIGAGTGQLTRLFAARCPKVYAVEPDASMRHVASEALKTYPNITIIDAAAEQIPLSDNSIDLIVLGNAYHRFQAEAIHELRRILKPAGWIAVISYFFTDASFSDLLFPRLNTLKSFVSRSEKNWHRLPEADLFGDQPMHTLKYAQSWSEDWEAFWGSACAGIEAPEPTDEEFTQFEAINQDVFDTLSIDGYLRMVYETRVVFGQPKP
jgi:ubiquinone/menaquinone biosynthesis C-methylase UbiE